MGIGIKPQLQMRQATYRANSDRANLIDPYSPAFPAGGGYFRMPRRLGVVGLDHLEGRNVVAQLGQTGGLSVPTPSNKPPPVTEPVSYPSILVEKSEMRDVEINIEILPDRFVSERRPKAETKESGLPAYEIRDVHIEHGKIQRYSFVWKGSITIQTTFPANLSPTDTSAYGRGTGADLKTGNGTLGFHESCHRNDYMAYISKSDELAITGRCTPYSLPDSSPEVTVQWTIAKFPRFHGDVGQTVAIFKAAMASFGHEFDKWNHDIAKFSAHCTDEFGHSKSAYKRGGSASKHHYR
jgi:hypothetical protein